MEPLRPDRDHDLLGRRRRRPLADPDRDRVDHRRDPALRARRTAAAGPARRLRGGLHRWRRGGPRLSRRARPDRGPVYPGPVRRTAGRAPVPDRRHRPVAQVRADRAGRPRGPADQDPRLPDRVRRGRGGASKPRRHRAGGGGAPRCGPRRPAGRLPRHPLRLRHPAGRLARAPSQGAARLHGAGRLRGAARAAAHRQREDRPPRAARAGLGRGPRSGPGRAADADRVEARGDPCRTARAARAGWRERQLLRVRRPFADRDPADGPHPGRIRRRPAHLHDVRRSYGGRTGRRAGRRRRRGRPAGPGAAGTPG